MSTMDITTKVAELAQQLQATKAELAAHVESAQATTNDLEAKVNALIHL